MTIPTTETIYGVVFTIGEKELSGCGGFHLHRIEINFHGRTYSGVIDAALAHIESFRHHEFKRIVELLEQRREHEA